MTDTGKTLDKSGEAVWILPDQLSLNISSLLERPENTPVVMVEMLDREPGVKMHKLRLAFILSSMRHFRDVLLKAGHPVEYYAFRDSDPNRADLCLKGYRSCLEDYVKNNNPRQLVVTQPTQYSVDYDLRHELAGHLGIPIEVMETNQFLTSRDEFKGWEQEQTELVMENFYRLMRQRWGILVDEDGEPEGGKWNFDAENRVPPMGNMEFPSLPESSHDEITEEVFTLIEKQFSDYPGSLENFYMPVTHEEAWAWFQDFLNNRMRLFGMYQDAMLKGEWYMYHSLISPLLNSGLLDPLAVLKEIERCYREEDVPINSAEGFVRQILGWREYINGIYWTNMPEYIRGNFFDHQLEIPQMLYDGKCRMSCIKELVLQTHERGYAHHIQRLMIIGNFCLLAQVKPSETLKWFLEAHIDAHEWAAVPNVIGMILFADGGYLGTKPYAASANYIGKMSDYCRGCYYKARKRVGERACPYNFLYWYFLRRNDELLKDNPRMSMVYNLLYRKTDSEMNLIVKSSEDFIGMLKKSGTDREII